MNRCTLYCMNCVGILSLHSQAIASTFHGLRSCPYNYKGVITRNTCQAEIMESEYAVVFAYRASFIVQILGSFVSDNHFEQGRVLPPIEYVKEVNTKIAVQLVAYAYRNQLANYYPEPKDKNYFIKSQQYSVNYTPVLPCEYSWPVEPSLLQQ